MHPLLEDKFKLFIGKRSASANVVVKYSQVIIRDMYAFDVFQYLDKLLLPSVSWTCIYGLIKNLVISMLQPYIYIVRA